MIFITLGSQKFQFDRLLKTADELAAAGKMKDSVFAQTGYSNYKPKYFAYKNFLNHDEFTDAIEKSNVVITHGGTGTIIKAIKMGKKVIAVPRLSVYGEHVDDHQIQLISQFEESNLILACRDCRELAQALEKVKKTNFQCYKSNTEVLIKNIEKFIFNENEW